jgi:hypothetical protein
MPTASIILRDRALRDLLDHLNAAHDCLEAEADGDDQIVLPLRRAINTALAALGGAADFLRQVREGAP